MTFSLSPCSTLLIFFVHVDDVSHNITLLPPNLVREMRASARDLLTHFIAQRIWMQRPPLDRLTRSVKDTTLNCARQMPNKYHAQQK